MTTIHILWLSLWHAVMCCLGMHEPRFENNLLIEGVMYVTRNHRFAITTLNSCRWCRCYYDAGEE